jgi:hypothetical protein
MGGVLDDDQAVGVRDGADGVQIAGQAGQVDWEDGAQPAARAAGRPEPLDLRRRLAQPARIEVERKAPK